MDLAELRYGARCDFAERHGEPILVSYDHTELHRFDLQGRAIDAPVPLPIVGGNVAAGGGLALVTRPFKGFLVDLATGKVLETFDPIQDPAAVSARGTRIALSHGRPGADCWLTIRDAAKVGVRGYPPAVGSAARPLWVGEDTAPGRADWELLYVLHNERIARYSNVRDESRTLVALRHGTGPLSVASDGSVIACAGSREVRFIAGEDGAPVATTPRGFLAVGPGRRIAVSSKKGQLWATGPEGERRAVLDKGYVRWLAYSLDGALLAWGGQHGRFGVMATAEVGITP